MNFCTFFKIIDYQDLTDSSRDCGFRVPFGGVKQGGIGRELGEAGLEVYTQIKAVHANAGTKL